MVFLFIIAFAPAGPICAENVTLSTKHSSSTGRYRTVNANDRLDVGTAVTNGNANLYGNLTIEKAAGSVGATSGGKLTIERNLSITDAAGLPLFFVDSVNNRVGVGNAAPQMTLDVTGTVRSLIIQSYASAATGDAGFFELFAANDAFENARGNERVSTVCHASGAPPGVNDYDVLPLYIDGNPLVLQGMVKPGVVPGLGRGQVVIKGDPRPASAAVLVLGYPGYGEVYAGGILLPSSLEFKKDVQPLTAQNYQEILEGLDHFTVARFRYLQDSPDKPRQLGFIAEEAPKQVQADKAVSLNDTYGYLFAATKALKDDQDRLKARVEALKR